MNSQNLLGLLRRDIRKVPREHVGSGFFHPLAKPRPFAPLLENILDTDEERETYAGTFETWPGNAAQLLDRAGLIRPLLTFNWLGFGPTSSSAGLALIGSPDQAWLAFWDEWGSYRAVAALSSPNDPAVVSAASRAYIANRPQFPEPIEFGSLPGTTFSHCEELLPEEVVATAYIEHLSNPSRGFTDGRNFIDEYIDVSAQPNHLEYCRTVLKRALVPAGEEDPDGLGGLRGDGASGRPSTAVCKAMFESWWKGAYQGW